MIRRFMLVWVKLNYKHGMSILMSQTEHSLAPPQIYEDAHQLTRRTVRPI